MPGTDSKKVTPQTTFADYAAKNPGATPEQYIVAYLNSDNPQIQDRISGAIRDNEVSRLFNQLALTSFDQSESQLASDLIDARNKSESAFRDKIDEKVAKFISQTCDYVNDQIQFKPAILQAIKSKIKSEMEAQYNDRCFTSDVENNILKINTKIEKIKADIEQVNREYDRKISLLEAARPQLEIIEKEISEIRKEIQELEKVDPLQRDVDSIEKMQEQVKTKEEQLEKIIWRTISRLKDQLELLETKQSSAASIEVKAAIQKEMDVIKKEIEQLPVILRDPIKFKEKINTLKEEHQLKVKNPEAKILELLILSGSLQDETVKESIIRAHNDELKSQCELEKQSKLNKLTEDFPAAIILGIQQSAQSKIQQSLGIISLDKLDSASESRQNHHHKMISEEYPKYSAVTDSMGRTTKMSQYNAVMQELKIIQQALHDSLSKVSQRRSEISVTDPYKNAKVEGLDILQSGLEKIQKNIDEKLHLVLPVHLNEVQRQLAKVDEVKNKMLESSNLNPVKNWLLKAADYCLGRFTNYFKNTLEEAASKKTAVVVEADKNLQSITDVRHPHP